MTPSDPPTAPPNPGGDAAPAEDVEHGRRRFTRGVAPAVLGALVSPPVLAGGDRPPYRCTMSGKLSGNTSAPRDNTVNCASLGQAPNIWKATPSWPAGIVAGTLPNSGQCYADGTFNSKAGTRFNGYTSNGRTLGTAFKCKGGTVYDVAQGFPGGSSAATMLQVLSTGGRSDTPLQAFGRVTVATLLNAHRFAPTFPLSPSQVIEMFNATYAGGVYRVNASTSWNMATVQLYFQSLYDANVTFPFPYLG